MKKFLVFPICFLIAFITCIYKPITVKAYYENHVLGFDLHSLYQNTDYLHSDIGLRSFDVFYDNLAGLTPYQNFAMEYIGGMNDSLRDSYLTYQKSVYLSLAGQGYIPRGAGVNDYFYCSFLDSGSNCTWGAVVTIVMNKSAAKKSFIYAEDSSGTMDTFPGGSGYPAGYLNLRRTPYSFCVYNYNPDIDICYVVRTEGFAHAGYSNAFYPLLPQSDYSSSFDYAYQSMNQSESNLEIFLGTLDTFTINLFNQELDAKHAFVDTVTDGGIKVLSSAAFAYIKETYDLIGVVDTLFDSYDFYKSHATSETIFRGIPKLDNYDVTTFNNSGNLVAFSSPYVFDLFYSDVPFIDYYTIRTSMANSFNLSNYVNDVALDPFEIGLFDYFGISGSLGFIDLTCFSYNNNTEQVLKYITDINSSDLPFNTPDSGSGDSGSGDSGSGDSGSGDSGSGDSGSGGSSSSSNSSPVITINNNNIYNIGSDKLEIVGSGGTEFVTNLETGFGLLGENGYLAFVGSCFGGLPQIVISLILFTVSIILSACIVRAILKR